MYALAPSLPVHCGIAHPHGRNPARSNPMDVNAAIPLADLTDNNVKGEAQPAGSGAASGPIDKKSAPRPSAAKAEAAVKSSNEIITCDEDKDLEMIWICTECREAECLSDPESPLLVCEGPCARPFHYPCAGLAAVPPGDEAWICSDCKASRHQCAVCKEYGNDDDGVFNCSKGSCNLYFHENCLSMYENVDVTLVEETVETKEVGPDGREVVTTQVVCRPKFECPAHSCWTCSGGVPPVPHAQCIPCDKKGEDSCAGVKKKTKKGGKAKKKKKSSVSSAFGEKREQLFRCLDCPIAYHITCIPPSARFHELALLCHEHCANKLPDLDNEHSFQAEVEADADRRFEQMRDAKRRKLEKARRAKDKNKEMNDEELNYRAGFNRFLFGMKGHSISEKKDEIYRAVMQEASICAGTGVANEQEGPRLPKKLRQVEFGLPFDFQQEVFSKPPMYSNVHGLKYDSSNRPKKHPPSNDFCKCKEKCDEQCLNKMIMTECVGDMSKGKGEKNPYANCCVGPSCGNRMMGQRKFAKCRPKREQGKGWGLIVVNGVKKGGLVQEYGGEVIDEQTKEARLNQWAKDHPNDPNFYIMSLEHGWYIDAREKGNLARFINHSCGPNCVLIPINVAGNIRVAVVALRDIAPGEFLCYDYQFDTKHGDKFLCRCGAPNCRGTMKGGEKGGQIVEAKKTRKELWAEAKARFDRDKKYMEEVADDQARRLNQTDFLRPGELEMKDSATAVASGPQDRDRDYAQTYRIFLWRSAVCGSDFSSRYLRHERKRGPSIPKSTACLAKVDVLSQVRG